MRPWALVASVGHRQRSVGLCKMGHLFAVIIFRGHYGTGSFSVINVLPLYTIEREKREERNTNNQHKNHRRPDLLLWHQAICINDGNRDSNKTVPSEFIDGQAFAI